MVLVLVLVVSILFVLLKISITYVTALAVGIEISVMYPLLSLPIVELLLFLPISIQGFGLWEVSYAYFLDFVGVSPAKAVSLGLLVQILMIGNAMIGAGVCFNQRRRG